MTEDDENHLFMYKNILQLQLNITYYSTFYLTKR